MTDEEKHARKMERQRAHRKAHPEYWRDCYRRDRDAHRELHMERQKAWREAHPDKQAESCRRWIENNRDHKNELTRRRSAVLQSAGGNFTKQDAKHMFLSQGGKCAICMGDISLGYHADHMNPISRGGTNDASNRQLLCRECNLRKGVLTMEEFSSKYLRVN